MDSPDEHCYFYDIALDDSKLNVDTVMSGVKLNDTWTLNTQNSKINQIRWRDPVYNSRLLINFGVIKKCLE